MRHVENYPEFPLSALEAVVRIRRCLDEVEDRAIETARERGATWEDIATALGVTRQAVYQKYRHHHEAAPRGEVTGP